MHTRSQTRNLHNQQHQAPPAVVEPFNLENPFENHPPPPPPPMDDQRTMAQLLEAPTEGYENEIYLLLREVPERPSTSVKLWLFPFSSRGAPGLELGGQLLDKMPRDCLRIIESKSKVRNSCNKPVVAKVMCEHSTLGISSEKVAEFKRNGGKLYSLTEKSISLFTPVKEAIISKNMSLKQPQLISTKETPVIEPRFQIKFDHPIFLPFKTLNVQNHRKLIRMYNQNDRELSIKLQSYPTPVFKVSLSTLSCVQPPCCQAPAYQAPAPQIQGVSKEDFHSYVKANDAVMRNMQTQGIKRGITTRSGVAYKGPTIPITSSPPKVMERDTENQKGDTMHI
ncbi:hypothetical protein Tco_0373454 [Tanacetum coccineum]